MGNKTIVAQLFDQYLDIPQELRVTHEGFEENLEALLHAGADVNACSYMWKASTSEAVTVLRAARDVGLDDKFIQILLRHGAIEAEEA